MPKPESTVKDILDMLYEQRVDPGATVEVMVGVRGDGELDVEPVEQMIVQKNDNTGKQHVLLIPHRFGGIFEDLPAGRAEVH